MYSSRFDATTVIYIQYPQRFFPKETHALSSLRSAGPCSPPPPLSTPTLRPVVETESGSSWERKARDPFNCNLTSCYHTQYHGKIPRNSPVHSLFSIVTSIPIPIPITRPHHHAVPTSLHDPIYNSRSQRSGSNMCLPPPSPRPEALRGRRGSISRALLCTALLCSFPRFLDPVGVLYMAWHGAHGSNALVIVRNANPADTADTST